MKQLGILMGVLLLLNYCLCRPQETDYQLCKPKSRGFAVGHRTRVHVLDSKGPGGRCRGCAELKNCTTMDGAIEIQGFRMISEETANDLNFPKLTEITGYLLVSLLYNIKDLKRIFPNLAVIRGGSLFLDYALVIYQNNGLEQINLPSLTTILSGGIRIEKNINLCYIKTIRWRSIMRANSDDPYSLVIASNNNDCYDLCYKGKCLPPAGHGASGQQYCWSSGQTNDYSCLKLCDMKCGGAGCVKGQDSVCCHSQCLGGCFQHNSPRHCYACKRLRLSNGECVDKCPGGSLEIDDFRCIPRACPWPYYIIEPGRCVKECPAGYAPVRSIFIMRCEKCVAKRCPRVCRVGGTARPAIIDSLSSLRNYKGCTEITGNLEIRIRGGGKTIAKALEDNLGMIEEVNGYVAIRESMSIMSLKFLKNLRFIKPQKRFDLNSRTWPHILYNDRYALTIMENPKLEALWDFHPNLTITVGGVIVRMNPRLCPKKINPLINDVLKWKNSSTERHIDVSQTSNGNAVACHVKDINMTVTEILHPASSRCLHVCVQVSWDEVLIKNDYRNVLFYTLSYREAPHTGINEFDDVDACSSEIVWQRVDVPTGDPRPVNTSGGHNVGPVKLLSKFIMKLKPFTLYAFYVEAATLNNTGAKSAIKFIRTREMVPSAVVGLEVSYLDSKALLVKWQPPLYPNGNITKYRVEYELSQYSVWTQDIDWCVRQILPSRTKTSDKDSNKDRDPNGNCRVNITCDCKKDKEVDKPEKQAARFAKEFQDALFKTLFTKDKDDINLPTNQTITAPTTATAVYTNTTNCSSQDQLNGVCNPSTSITITSIGSSPRSTETTTTENNSTANATVPTPTTPTLILEANGTMGSMRITHLEHFADYTITVCACTKAGCAFGTGCSGTKGRTDKKARADDLGGPLRVQVNNATKSFNLSWIKPPNPNGIVLKYEVKIRHALRSTPEVVCQRGRYHTWIVQERPHGNYTVSVRAITPAGNGSWSQPIVFVIAEEKDDNGGKEKISQERRKIGIIVGLSLATCSVIILTCGLVVWYIARKRYRDKQIPTVLYASVNPEYMNSTDVYIADEWEVPRENIKLIRELGNGSFGMVYEGEAMGIVLGQPKCRVAVKTVSENASIRDRIEFLQEASIMKAFECHHVVQLRGVVSDGQPTLVIMELMENGDLKNFLRSRRPGEGTLPPPTLEEMLQMAGEIADGMAYLAARKFVHRDLAARNCMVNAEFGVKIGDFGMTRDIYETDYYRKGGKGLLPVRWMAPESLKDGVFTSPSDVWSFGVVLWEMATLASQPYPGKSNEEVLKHVVDGNVMPKPDDGCPDKLFTLMTLCWQFNPKSRPTFLSLINILEPELSDKFAERSFYHNLPRDQLREMLKTKCHHIPRQRAETVQSEMDSSTSA